ncbi:MAG: DsbA family protein [Patescibacteria group bacterium]|nr:DsbA family protein [Patescibacteria group bacterium]
MKKAITIIVIVLVALGVGIFLFIISPEQQVQPAGNYNAAIVQNQNIAAITEPPAFDPSVDHYLGNPNAKNVFIEYGDMQCPYCAEFNPQLIQIPSKFPDTAFVFRYFPLLQHPNTVEAGLAAEAAGAQGKYWEMHDLLLANQAKWENLADPLDAFVQYAQQIGVTDVNTFKNDIINKKYLQPMQKGEDESFALKLQGTPSYFFNGHVLPLETTLDGLLQAAQPYLKN